MCFCPLNQLPCASKVPLWWLLFLFLRHKPFPSKSTWVNIWVIKNIKQAVIKRTFFCLESFSFFSSWEQPLWGFCQLKLAYCILFKKLFSCKLKLFFRKRRQQLNRALAQLPKPEQNGRRGHGMSRTGGGNKRVWKSSRTSLTWLKKTLSREKDMREHQK